MTEYLKNNYIIKITTIENSDNFNITVNNDSSKYSIFIDNTNDAYGNTNCDNNITLLLNSDLYTFINNCLKQEINYN